MLAVIEEYRIGHVCLRRLETARLMNVHWLNVGMIAEKQMFVLSIVFMIFLLMLRFHDFPVDVAHIANVFRSIVFGMYGKVSGRCVLALKMVKSGGVVCRENMQQEGLWKGNPGKVNWKVRKGEV